MSYHILYSKEYLCSYPKGHNKEENRIDGVDAFERAKKCWDAATGKKSF